VLEATILREHALLVALLLRIAWIKPKGKNRKKKRRKAEIVSCLSSVVLEDGMDGADGHIMMYSFSIGIFSHTPTQMYTTAPILSARICCIINVETITNAKANHVILAPWFINVMIP